MKTCFKCNQEKDFSEFYKHKETLDGLLGKCKSCTKSDVTSNRWNNISRVRKYDRDRSDLKHRLAARARYAKEWDIKNPQKRKAITAVNNAVRDGRLLKWPCEVCGNSKSHGHHKDYYKPLDVVWLCAVHHKEAHK